MIKKTAWPTLQKCHRALADIHCFPCGKNCGRPMVAAALTSDDQSQITFEFTRDDRLGVLLMATSLIDSIAKPTDLADIALKMVFL